uniref:DUF4378 domain-containing protein n=1 Tax=Noctiluca scintillans TaxID=2966 RepID=A0A7S1AVJ9_NOCSC
MERDERERAEKERERLEQELERVEKKRFQDELDRSEKERVEEDVILVDAGPSDQFDQEVELEHCSTKVAAEAVTPDSLLEVHASPKERARVTPAETGATFSEGAALHVITSESDRERRKERHRGRRHTSGARSSTSPWSSSELVSSAQDGHTHAPFACHVEDEKPLAPDAGFGASPPVPDDMRKEESPGTVPAEQTLRRKGSKSSSPATKFSSPSGDGDLSSDTSAVSNVCGSPLCSESAALKDVMLHSKHKKMLRKLIPSYPHEDPSQHSAPSSTRSLYSNSSTSSSAVASNDRVLENDHFTKFTCDLAKKIDQEDEARASMVEQLFRLQQRALEKKVREKMRHLESMEVEKSSRWVEKRMRKARKQAEAEHAELQRQLARSKVVRDASFSSGNSTPSSSSSSRMCLSFKLSPPTSSPALRQTARLTGPKKSVTLANLETAERSDTDQSSATTDLADRHSVAEHAGAAEVVIANDKTAHPRRAKALSKGSKQVWSAPDDEGDKPVNFHIIALRKDMESTRQDIQASRKEKEWKVRELQRQKEEAIQLYKQKKVIITERVRLFQLEQQEREAEEFLEKALMLSVDDEVQKQITETAPCVGEVVERGSDAIVASSHPHAFEPSQGVLEGFEKPESSPEIVTFPQVTSISPASPVLSHSPPPVSDLPFPDPLSMTHGNLPLPALVLTPVSPASSSAGASESIGKASAGAGQEWKARESHLDALRAEVAEKKRAVKQLAAERQRQLQNREEQRLLRQLQRIEEQAEKLRQPLDLSDAETCVSSASDQVSASTALPASASVVADDYVEGVDLQAHHFEHLRPEASKNDSTVVSSNSETDSLLGQDNWHKPEQRQRARKQLASPDQEAGQLGTSPQLRQQELFGIGTADATTKDWNGITQSSVTDDIVLKLVDAQESAFPRKEPTEVTAKLDEQNRQPPFSEMAGFGDLQSLEIHENSPEFELLSLINPSFNRSPGSLSDQDSERSPFSFKDVAPSPPRPASPPPDRRLGSEGKSEGKSGSRKRHQAVDTVEREVFEILVDEICTDLSATDPVPVVPKQRSRSRSRSPSRAGGVRSPGGSSPAPSPTPKAEAIDTSEVTAKSFLDIVQNVLGGSDEDNVATTLSGPLDSWFPRVLEQMQKESSSKKELNLEAKATRDKDTEGWTRLLAEALVEVSGEEPRPEPRKLGWRRPVFGEQPLARFRAQQADGHGEPKNTWARASNRLQEVVRFGSKAGEENNHEMDVSNIDENITSLIDEEICIDDASWQDISNDVKLVKNQIVQMIFSDLVDEMAEEIQSLWPT